MKKRIGKRLVSLLLTFVTILTMLPAMTLPALAATSGTVTGLTDQNIDLSFKGNADNAWSARSASGTIIRGSVNGYGTVFTRNHKSTLTITNDKGTTATLSFDYTIEKTSGGTIQVNGTPVTAGNSISVELERGSFITVSIDSGKGDGQSATIAMTNVKLVAHVDATVTFQPAENGSYKVGGKTITDTYTNKQIATKAYQVAADPAPGYQFMDWYDASHNKSISRVPNANLNIEKDCTIKARFTHKDLALFETDGLVYDDLTNAITAASRNPSALITQVGDGMISGNYTIPSGVTLLIPFDEMETLYTSKPSYVNTAETPTAYKTLTMASGSSIIVNGAISVGGKHFAGSSGSCCKATGPYGQIIMQGGSAIKLNRDANLYAWGYITGDGQITANSGATVYEYFQVTDWRGGNAVLSMVTTPTNHVFPFSQYYVQNIEAPLTIQNGATEKAYYSVTANDATVSTSIDFIGSTGLFKLEAGGSIIKRYVPATGRTEYTTNGTACLDRLAVTMKVLGISYTIDSKNYVLPINGNMILNIASGKVKSNYDLCLLPGVQINIAKDAELEIAQDADLYVYASEQWGTYCNPQKKLIDVDYSPTLGRHVRTEADLVDAKIDLNGKLTAIGSVYTTASGANICSSEGTGKYVQQSKPGTESTTHQATQKGSDITYVSIPITAAQLKNAADGSYTSTAGSKAGDTFTYCTCPECNGKWMKNLQVAEIGATKYDTLQKAVGNLEAGQYIKLLHNTTEDIKNITKDIYLDLNGRTVTGDISVTGAYKLSGMDSSVSKDYVTAPSGKIVGTVTGTVAPTYQTPTVKEEYDRYVAIQGTEADGNTPNLSFHHFNISVSGYRFELATGDTPQCALFFIGKFQGDAEAKKHLTSLGITLTGDNGPQLGTYSYSIPKDKAIPKESDPGESPVVRDVDDDAFLFEAYLMRDINKENYQTKFTATARATFDNDGKQDSKPQQLSFKDAWTDPKMVITPEQKTILENFKAGLGITD